MDNNWVEIALRQNGMNLLMEVPEIALQKMEEIRETSEEDWTDRDLDLLREAENQLGDALPKKP
jgi:hypothetical protein